jgi:hypothetical protein
MPVTACDPPYDRVLRFYEELGIPVSAILKDNGREFCGRPEQHPYEPLTAMERIEHRTTKIRSPPTNGFIEQMDGTMLDECFRVTGRTIWGENVERYRPTSASPWSTTTSNAAIKGIACWGAPRRKPRGKLWVSKNSRQSCLPRSTSAKGNPPKRRNRATLRGRLPGITMPVQQD